MTSHEADMEPELDEDLRLPKNTLAVDDFMALVAAAVPLWRELERLGWTDGYGGMEFKHMFADVLDFIHTRANAVPQTPESAHGLATDETVADLTEDDVQKVGDEE